MTTTRHPHKFAEPRSGLATLSRPRYAQGQMLQDDDPSLAVEHPRELQRLLMRSLLGCGVICGFKVDAAETACRVSVTVAPGMALDPAGQVLQLPTLQTLVIDTSCCEPPLQFHVAIRHVERGCLPRATACDSDLAASTTANTRINEGWEIQLFPGPPPDGCGCSVLSTQVAALTAAGAYALAPNGGSKPTGKGARANTSKSAAKEVGTPANTVEAALDSTDCPCTSKGLAGYEAHYAGLCGSCSDDEWVVLAWVLAAPDTPRTSKDLQAPAHKWLVDHSVRRFIRPLLMRDPLVAVASNNGSAGS